MISLKRVYSLMLKKYGPQGWWPLMDEKSFKCVYSRREFLTGSEEFEIALGAVLTQNVSWKNVEKALGILKAEGILFPEILHEMRHEALASRIRSTGYYNQKAIKIRHLLDWMKLRGYSLAELKTCGISQARDILLSIKGIGPETADSILLYALNRKIFVVDAYTRRILTRLGIIGGDESYEGIQSLFHEKFAGGFSEYQEYHALIVEHAKVHCAKKPQCHGCLLRKYCQYALSSRGHLTPDR
jgi:endonuclease-3 related protein